MQMLNKKVSEVETEVNSDHEWGIRIKCGLYKYAHVRASEQYIEELTTMFFRYTRLPNVLPPPQRIVSDEAKHTQTRVHDLCRILLDAGRETVDLEGQDQFGFEYDRSTPNEARKLSLLHVR
jgi:hypothetical protein